MPPSLLPQYNQVNAQGPSIFAPNNIILSSLHPMIQKTIPKYGSGATGLIGGASAHYHATKRHPNPIKEYSIASGGTVAPIFYQP